MGGAITSRNHWLHATLKGVVALAPAGQSELCAVLADFFPYKLMPAAVQQQYVSQLLAVCQYLPHFQPKILELIISKCLEIDVDIVIEEGGAAELCAVTADDGEGDEDPSGLLFDLDDVEGEEEDGDDGDDGGLRDALGFMGNGAMAYPRRRGVRTHGAAASSSSSGGAFETYCGGSSSHRIGADVAEMADKLDGMLALLMNFISGQFGVNDSTRERLFFQLLGTFEKIVLTVHRAKFVQFIMFYMCAKHQPYAVVFARRLLEIFADPQQSASGSAVRRQSAVMYLASFLSRLAPLSPAIIRCVRSSLLETAAFVFVANIRDNCL
jgi:RNA polymerase I-specific transcription initiation factor RRN3